MNETRTKHVAEYDYPGLLFPESTSRQIPEPTFAAAVTAGPAEDDYFRKDGWYAVTVRSTVEKRYESEDGDEAWVNVAKPQVVGKWVVGERIHYSDIEQTDANSILIGNIKCNSRDGGYGVLTRCGNWQIASDYTAVVPTSIATRP